jgi:hypothetical protein
LIVPTGADVAQVQIPEKVRDLLGSIASAPMAVDVEANAMERKFKFIGVTSCLVQAGYCVLRG